MRSFRTPSRSAAHCASLVRAEASAVPAAMPAKSRTPLAPSVAITRCVSRPSRARRESSGPITRSSSGWANTARIGRALCARAGDTLAAESAMAAMVRRMRMPYAASCRDGAGGGAYLPAAMFALLTAVTTGSRRAV